MAGRGQRFVDRGYEDPKPLIDVAGRAMIAQSLRCLPRPSETILIARSEHASDARLVRELERIDPGAVVLEVPEVTQGQACTAELGVRRLSPDTPVLIAPCDTGYVYDLARWKSLEDAMDADLIVWSARNHLPAMWRPSMYGWLKVEGDRVVDVAVKRPVDGVVIEDQQVVTGTFWFRSARLYLDEVEELYAADDRVNGEFYVDTLVRRMVAKGRRVVAFVVDKYMPWGTPEELETFSYWNDVHRTGRSI